MAVIGVGHYRATLSPNSLRILPDQKLDNGGARDPNRDIAEHRAKAVRPHPSPDYRAWIEDQARIRAVFISEDSGRGPRQRRDG